MENIKEQISSIIFDRSQDKGVALNKRFLEAIAKFIVSAFFILDALDKTLSNQRTYWIASYKIHGIETNLINAGILSTESKLASTIAPSLKIILYVVGLIQIICSVGLNFYEDQKTKQQCAQILLLIILVFDSLIINFPSSQEDANYANEINHIIANIGLSGALFMIIGLRSDEEE